jgi:hypothetical protein
VKKKKTDKKRILIELIKIQQQVTVPISDIRNSPQQCPI